jgi:hypothetical protein
VLVTQLCASQRWRKHVLLSLGWARSNSTMPQDFLLSNLLLHTLRF